MERRRKQKWEDAFWGFVIGDAIGLPSETKTPDQIARSPVRGIPGYGTHNRGLGTWGQPTSLMWAALDGLHGVKDYGYNASQVRGAVLDNLHAWVSFGRFTADGAPIMYADWVSTRIKGWELNAAQTLDQSVYRLNKEIESETSDQQQFMGLPLVFAAALYSAADSPNAFRAVYILMEIFGNDLEDLWAGVFYMILLHELSHSDRTQAILQAEKRAKRLAEEYDLLPEQQEPGWGVNPVMSRAYEDRDWSVGQVETASELLALSLQVLYHTDTMDAGLLWIANQGGPSSTWGAVAGSLLGMCYSRDSMSHLWDHYLCKRAELQISFDRTYLAFHEDSPFNGPYWQDGKEETDIIIEHL